MAGVPRTIVEFELEVHVIAARKWPIRIDPIAAASKLVTSRIAMIHVDGDNHIVASGLPVALASTLRTSNGAARTKVGIQVVLIVRKFVLQDVDVGMVGILRGFR